MSDWQVLPDADALAAGRFADLDTVFTLEGEVVARDSLTLTLRVEINGRRYYVKRYSGLGKKPLRRWFGTSRVQMEWQNLQRFADWGIPTARLVAYGLERRGGRFVRGALITAEIPATTDLRKLARSRHPRLKSRRKWDGVAAQIAEIARRMHSRRFAHGDLKWRNLLVDDAGKVFLIDCPSGGFWRPPFLKYRIIKDLACLDKVAKLHLSRTWRLRFYLDYVQKKKLDAADKEQIRKIVGFFDGRELARETAVSLRASGRELPVFCTMTLDNGRVLAINRWLRVLPGKRLTGIASYQGQTVLAKLFIAARGSERHWQREYRGIESLKAHGLPTPKLLATGRLDGAGYFVLTKYVEGARSPSPNIPVADELGLVFEMVSRMHAQGILQDDVHLGNFLLRDRSLYVIDGDAIRPASSAQDCADNLALLFAQLPPATCKRMQAGLLTAYRKGNPDLVIDEAHLGAAIARARDTRLADHLDKCLRDCSLFKVARRVDLFFSIVRSEVDFLAPLVADPDTWLRQGVSLKRGRTATLALVELNGRKLVIKRYNIKGPGHALARAWRRSRAWHSWIEGHRLQFLGIPTPRPLALIERRIGPLRGRAWLVTEFCPGKNLARHLATQAGTPPAPELAAIGQLFAQLAGARISHGDLKAANLLWHDGKINLVDLDALRQHASDSSFARAWHDDRERFLRNWPDNPVLRGKLETVLPE